LIAAIVDTFELYDLFFRDPSISLS
jgi:hypothetical protein